MDKQDSNPFENYQPIKGDARKQEKLYKKMVHLSESGNLPEKPQRTFAKFLTPAIVLALFFIMIPFVVNNEQSSIDRPKEEEKKVITEITKRNDWYYGEGAYWFGYINLKSAEVWLNKDVKDHESWSASSGELNFKGENPGKIKHLNYQIEGKNGKSGRTEQFDGQPFEGTIDMGYGAGNGYTQEDAAIKVTIEWDGKKEVIPFIHDPNKSTTKQINRTKEVSPVNPYHKDSDQFLPEQFLVAGEGNFQLGASTWDPLMAQMENVEPSLEQWNGSQNVLLMFKDLTTITDELTIKGKHESDTEEILFKAPIYQNAVESFKEYDWVIPANLSFKKDGIWTLTAYEGDKKVGTVTIDVERTAPSFVPSPLFEDEMVRGVSAGLFPVENVDGKPTIFLGDHNSQKVLWKFFGPWPEEVIIQGLHENGETSFTTTLEDIKKSEDQDRVYERVSSVKLKKEGLWNFRFYSNEGFLGEITLNAKNYD